MEANVSVSNTTRTRISPAKVKRLVASAARAAAGKRKVCELSVVFVGDARMRTLNKGYRAKDATTDVLSFTYEDTRDELSGEVVVSVPQARRQAREYGHSFEQELFQLVVHGVAHIAGHTHDGKKDTERMRRVEKRIWHAFTKK